jgi:monoamine oxidase
MQKTVNAMIRLEDGRWLTMNDALKVSPELEITRSWDFGLNNNVPEPLDEEDLGTYLTRIGFNAEQLKYVQRSFANAEGDNMELINAKAHAHFFSDRTEEGYDDCRILNGYDAYYTVLAEGLDIRLNTTVTAVEWSADGVVVTTAHGQSFRADKAIITLPVGVLLANKVKFTPALPSIKQEALEGLRMGPVMKMIYEFDAPITNDSISVIFAKGNPPMWWSPSLGQDSDIVVWVAFFSGDYAREMLHLGENKALQKGLETLREQVGNPDLVYKKARWVSWPQDEFALGGYSICLPGHYDAREKLAQPTPPLYWAGEASAPHHQSATVHGAYLTGQRAANEV